MQEKEITRIATLIVEAGLRISLIDFVLETLGLQLVVLFQEVRRCNLAGGSCYQRLTLRIHCLALHSVLSLSQVLAPFLLFAVVHHGGIVTI